MAKRLHKEQNLELKYKAGEKQIYKVGAGERQNQQRGCTIIWCSSKYTFHMKKSKQVKWTLDDNRIEKIISAAIWGGFSSTRC